MINFYIPNKKPNEKIILLMRRHAFILLARIMLWIIIGLVPLPISFLFSQAGAAIVNFETARPIIIIFAGIYYLSLLLIIFNTFVDYYLDVWIVTNFRIVNIEQRQIFSRVTSEHELSKIQDITAEVHGLLPTFLDFGDVHVQTAGETQRFIFRQVPHPLEVKRKIATLCEHKKMHP